MTGDLKQSLDRAARRYDPPPDALERLVRRRERSRRIERLTALAVGLGIAAVVVGVAFFASRSSDGRSHPGDGAAASDRNGELLYSKYVGSGWHLHAVDPSTGVERAITDGVRDYESDWSPDGSQIVYDTEGGDIVVADADGSDPRVVGTGASPSWSPDGSRIAFARSEQSGGARIWVMNADGSDARAITEGPAAGPVSGQDAAVDWAPSWSPDGRSIAYVRVVAHRSPELPSGVGTTDVTLEELRVWRDGAQPSDVSLTDAYANLGPVDWSPDGATLVFTGGPTLFDEQQTNGIIHAGVLLVPADGGAVRDLPSGQDATGATWSPDGELIAFVEGDTSLVVMRPDGTDQHAVRIDPGEDSIIGPSWGVAPPSG